MGGGGEGAREKVMAVESDRRKSSMGRGGEGAGEKVMAGEPDRRKSSMFPPALTVFFKLAFGPFFSKTG